MFCGHRQDQDDSQSRTSNPFRASDDLILMTKDLVINFNLGAVQGGKGRYDPRKVE